MSSDLDEKSRWATEVTGPARDFIHKSLRRLVDLPPSVSEGAKEIAQLTAWRAAQDFALEPVMQALNKVRDLADWGKPFFVAPETTRFDWRDAPIKRYESFEDFYRQELAGTWGAWSDLQETYAKYSRGEITERQANDEIDRSAAGVLARVRDMPAGNREGRPTKQEQETRTKNNVRVSPGYLGGNSAESRFASLKRDAPDFANRYIAGEFRSVAAAVRASQGISDRVEGLKRLWSRATEAERTEFLAWTSVCQG